MERLIQLIDPEGVLPAVAAHDLHTCLRQLTAVLVARGTLGERGGEALLDALRQRETLGSTAIGKGVAVPHAYLDELSAPTVLLARLSEPLALAGPDEAAVDLVFLLTGPTGAEGRHLRLLAHLVRLLHDELLLAALRAAADGAAMHRAIAEAEARHA